MAIATTSKKPRIVFFGSGPVSAKSLELLLKNFSVEAVITKPKPPHHKQEFPVISVAKTNNLPIHLAKNKKELSQLFKDQIFESKLGVLIDFGIIVAQDVISYFPKGIINSHFSVLPEWRGADPITFAVLSGQKTTGVSLMLLVEKMDEGPLLAYGEYKPVPNITTPVLTDHLINFSDQMLTAEIPRYLAGAKPSPQTITGRKVSYSKKLKKSDGIVDWTKPAVQIEREIRAYLGWPRSNANLLGKDIIITKAHVTDDKGKPGNVSSSTKELIVFCGEKAIRIDKLIPSGKKEMTGKAFLAGIKRK